MVSAGKDQLVRDEVRTTHAHARGKFVNVFVNGKQGGIQFFFMGLNNYFRQ